MKSINLVLLSIFLITVFPIQVHARSSSGRINLHDYQEIQELDERTQSWDEEQRFENWYNQQDSY